MAVVTLVGKEWILETALDAASVSVLLYNNGTDAITKVEDLVDITTEPAEALGQYARQSATLEVVKVSTDWIAANDALITYDVTGESVSVDHWGIVATFTSVEAGDAVPTAHLIATGALSTTRNLSAFETLSLAVNKVGIEIENVVIPL